MTVYTGLGLLLAATAMSFAFPAHAHITFENKEVKAGTTVKFVLRIPHGCGALATTGVRISLPEQLSEAKPQPKPGWTLKLVTEDLHQASATSAHAHGGAATVKEISWSGGRLEDAFYDEFVFRAAVAKDAAGEIRVPVIQDCDGGTERWIEIPTSGGSAGDLKSPAPSVHVQP